MDNKPILRDISIEIIKSMLKNSRHVKLHSTEMHIEYEDVHYVAELIKYLYNKESIFYDYENWTSNSLGDIYCSLWLSYDFDEENTYIEDLRSGKFWRDLGVDANYSYIKEEF